MATQNPPPEPSASSEPSPAPAQTAPAQTAPAHPIAATAKPSPTRRIIAAGVAVASVVALAAFTPWERGLTGAPTGDTQLAAELEPFLDSGYMRDVSAAAIDPDGAVRFTGWGADEHDQFEIGSLTKTFTAALLSDAIERGELTAETTLGEVFAELEGTSAGDLTMEQLATQHTGLPKSVDSAPITQMWKVYLRLDPYSEDLPSLLERAQGFDTDPGTYVYSNTGVALLGHAVARAAGTEYPQLVHDRLLEPLGMEETIVPESPADLPADAPAGFTNSGLRTGPWTLGAEAPSGSIRSTAHDMAIWMQAVADGDAPGADAVEPRTELEDGGSIGYAWHVTPLDGTDITWHNGGTGGFRSYAGYSPDGRAVVVLSNTETSVDGAAGYLTTAPDGAGGAGGADAQAAPEAVHAAADDTTTEE